MLCSLAQSCLTLCNPMDCNPPDSFVHGILQARTLQWVPMLSSRGSSQPRDQTQISLIAGDSLPYEPIGKSTFLSSVQFSRSVMSDSLQPHESQHARPPCPSPTPRVYPNSGPSSRDAIQPSHPLSALFPPASNPSQHQSLFQ